MTLYERLPCWWRSSLQELLGLKKEGLTPKHRFWQQPILTGLRDLQHYVSLTLLELLFFRLITRELSRRDGTPNYDSVRAVAVVVEKQPTRITRAQKQLVAQIRTGHPQQTRPDPKTQILAATHARNRAA